MLSGQASHAPSGALAGGAAQKSAALRRGKGGPEDHSHLHYIRRGGKGQGMNASCARCMPETHRHFLRRLFVAAQAAGLEPGHYVARDGAVYLEYFGDPEAVAQLQKLLEEEGVDYTPEPGARSTEVAFPLLVLHSRVEAKGRSFG